MPRYAANLSILFPELPFPARFAAAKRAGFDAVEFWDPGDLTIAGMKSVLDGEGLTLVVLNTSFGNMAAGELGLAALPGREAEFEASLDRTLEYSAALGLAKVHIVAGNIDMHGEAACMTAYLNTLERSLRRVEGTGIELVIEPLNHRDRPHYLLQRSDVAAEIIGRLGSDNLKIMFDIYHVQINEGNIFARLRKYLPIIGHIQIAGVPERGEPDRGELDYRQIVAEIDRLGWRGWVGCEYKPMNPTEKGLGWIEKFRSV